MVTQHTDNGEFGLQKIGYGWEKNCFGLHIDF